MGGPEMSRPFIIPSVSRPPQDPRARWIRLLFIIPSSYGERPLEIRRRRAAARSHRCELRHAILIHPYHTHFNRRAALTRRLILTYPPDRPTEHTYSPLPPHHRFTSPAPAYRLRHRRRVLPIPLDFPYSLWIDTTYLLTR
jgi:hypothetical protein